MGVRDSQGGRRVEALDQQTRLIVGSEIGRTDHLVQSSFAEPIPSGAQELLSRSIVIDAFKKTKEACLFFIKIAIAEIVDGNDSSYHLFPSFQKKEAGLRVVPEKGVGAFVDNFFLLCYLGWKPVSILSINLPGKLDDFSPVLASQNSTQTIRS